MNFQQKGRVLYIEDDKELICRRCKKSPKTQWYYCEEEKNLFCYDCRADTFCNAKRMYHTDWMIEDIK